MKKRTTVPGLIVLVLFTGCYYDKEELLYPGGVMDCNTVNAAYVDVQPIIAAKCATAGCHNSASAAGGTVLETYAQIKASAGRINQRTIVEKTMPPGSPLSSGEIAILKCWISSGAPQ